MKYTQLLIRHRRNLLIVTVVVATLLGTVWMFAQQTGRVSAATVTGQVCGNASTGNAIDTVIVVAEENRTWSGGATAGVGLGFSPTNMPYLNSLTNQCAYFTNLTETNTSQNSATQYVGAWTGFSDSVTHVASDCSPSSSCSYNGNDIFDVFRTAGIGHREYVEGATSPCSASGNAAKHIPELYMWPESQVSSNASCQAEVRPFSEFSWSNPPTGYTFITPTLCNDGHDCSDTTVDNWLSTSTRLPALYSSAQYQQGKVLFEVWYDEDRQKPNVFTCWSCSHVASTTDPTYAGEAQLWLNLLGAPTANLGAISTATDIRPIIMNGTVTPPPVDNPPAVSITAPTSGSTLTTSPVTVNATATDDLGLTKVEFYADGVLKNTDTTAPYSFSWDNSALSGSHSLTAKAYDTDGNITTSAAVNVTVTIPPSCSVPTTYGSGTIVVSAPTGGTYHVWSRIMAPDTTNNSYYIEIDGNCPILVGDSATLAANSWTWLNYQDGNTATLTSATLTSGNHTITMIGREPGVKLDRVLMLSDSCTPSGTGANCTDSTPPTVSLTSPTNGQTVSSASVTLAATAADEAGGSGLTKVDFKVDGTIVGTDTTSPYQFTWNSTTVADGSHTIQAVATDGAGNTTASTAVTVTVSNAAPSDTTAPTIPANLRSTATSTTSISLAWDVSTDSGGSGLAGYKIYKNGTLLTTTTLTTYTDSGLTAATSYAYQVSAYDNATNESVKTAILNVSTAATAPSGDLNGDGHVTVTDLSILLSHYGQAAIATTGDINGDSTCNILDLSILLSHYGQ